MSWTYSGNPSASSLDAVRFKIGDTNTTDQLLSDEEINYLISEESTVIDASVEACKAIAASFARLSDETTGKVSVKYNQKYAAYIAMAKELSSLSDSSYKNIVPFSGGISVADKEARELNTDRVDPKFTKNLHDNEFIDNCDRSDGCGCN